MYRRFHPRSKIWAALAGVLLISLLTVSGCGWLFGGGPDRAELERLAAQELFGSTALTPDYISIENGDERVLDYDRHSATVLNFWATWCPPCLEELPMLQEFSERYQDNGIRVVGITRLWGDIPDSATRKRKLADLSEFILEHGITYPVIIDTGGTNFRDFSVSRIPTTIVVGSDGLIQDYRIGIEGTRDILDKVTRTVEISP